MPCVCAERKISKRPEAAQVESTVVFRSIPWFYEEYSTLLAKFFHLKTGYILPQYHFVFNDFFETAVLLGDNDPVIENICNERFDSSRDWHAEEKLTL